MKKTLAILVWCLLVAAPALPQKSSWDKIEFGLVGGLGFPQARPSSSYDRDYSATQFSRILFSNDITGEAKASIFLGGFCDFFFSRAFGVQAGFGFLSSNLPTHSAFDFSYTKTTTGTLQESWDGTGRLNSFPLHFNLMVKLRTGPFEGFLTAGPAVVVNTFKATSTAGLPTLIRYTSGNYEIDALPINLEIATTSWISIGANFSAGIGLKLADFAAFFVEARYCLCPKKEISWTWQTGYYTGLRGLLVNVNVVPDVVDDAQNDTSRFGINPSFFQISGGIKLLFGK